MKSRIFKVTVIILTIAFVLVETAPKWQLRAANDEEIVTTEISVDDGTEDVTEDTKDAEPKESKAPKKPDRQPYKEKNTVKNISKKPVAEKTSLKNKKNVSKNKKKNKAKAKPTPVPTYRPIEGRVLSHNTQYIFRLRKLKKENKRITRKRSALITKTQSLTVRQAYLKKMDRVIGERTLAVKVAATGTAVSGPVSAAAIQGLDSTIDQVVNQGYILCNPNYFDMLTDSGLETFFEEKETIDLGVYLDREIKDCGTELKKLNKPVRKLKKKYEKIHSRYIKGMKKHNAVFFDPKDLTVQSHATVAQMRKMLKGTALEKLAPVFVKEEKSYGINAIGLASIAALESDWGTSRRAREDHNLTGFGVNTDEAEGINASSDQENIKRTAGWIAENYLDENGIYYKGKGLPGINKYYSASYTWAWKVENCAQQMFDNL